MLDRKIAYVNLSDGSCEIRKIPLEWREKFLGGRGINMHLLSKSYASIPDPFSPENPLIFGAGLLTGLPGFGSRMNITSRSPESGHLGDSNMGGEFGAEMVKAGLSHLVITGKSKKPVFLFIKDGKIEFCDASMLKGLDALETQRRIRAQKRDPRVQTACIGPAGENRVRFAAVRNGMKSAAGRTGMGAVMGAKNLKAVAVRGSRDIRLSKPDAYRRHYLRTLKDLMKTKWAQALGKQGTPVLFRYSNALGFLSVRNNQQVTIGDRGPLLEAEALEPYSTGMIACFGCPVHCRHRFSMEKGEYRGTRGEGPEYASIGSLGTKLGHLNLETILYATHLCNLYGLDTISTGSYLAWVMELYQRGIIDERTTKVPLNWGDGKTIVGLLDQIAQRRGFGDILAEGSFAREIFGEESRPYLLEIKDFPIEMTDERLPKSFALGMATATRGACHMRSRPSIDAVGLPEAVLEKMYGGPVSERLSSYVGKARMVWWHELMNAVSDSLGICRFQSVFSSPHGLGYPHFSRLVDLAAGLHLTPAEIKKAGERIYTLERLMITGEGISRSEDTLPGRYFEEPIPEGPSKGEVVSREAFSRMLDEYYGLHGWDEEGIPTSRTLKRLGLAYED
ncbi:MAG: aldehyde ferredoxin oxidoreductase family protein [Desulfobacterota bacterium]|nr:aldehyde ferredoxin oxidoreductase family protein [Thermodesulfobacteriota bacterium]